MIYEALNKWLIEEVPRSAERVLDIGCGIGSLGKALKARQRCKVSGITHSPDEAKQAQESLDEVIIVDLDDSDSAIRCADYDVIICSHVLEHLKEPSTLLKQVRAGAADRTLLLVALPNVLHWRQRLSFFRGRFRYTAGGLMDRTHLRFFDWTSARALLEDSGWSVEKRLAQGHAPLVWRLPLIGSYIDAIGARTLPGLLGEQFILVARLSK